MASDSRDFKLELGGRPVSPPPAKTSGRPWLSVWFNCCGVYQRVYRSADGSRYTGHCPRCARPVRFSVGNGGTSARRFVVE